MKVIFFFIIRIFSVYLYNSANKVHGKSNNWVINVSKYISPEKDSKNEKFEKFEKSEIFRGINFHGKGQKTQNRESFWPQKFLTLK